MASPLRPEDIYRFRWIDHVRLDSGGERVAYQLTWGDAESRSNRSRVVVRRLLDAEPIEATVGPRRDHSPEWSPDGGRLAFVSRHGAADQIFVHELARGEPVQVTSIAEGTSSPVWSPDGTRLAFLGTVVGDPDGVVDDPRPPEVKDQVRRTPVARVVRTLDYKHDGQGYVDGRHRHAFVVPASGGEASQLTQGAWDVTGLTWNPDSTQLAVIGNADPDADLSRQTHLYRVGLDGGLEKITSGYGLGSPVWSPRGDLIAYVASASDEPGLHDRLWVVPAAGGDARCLTADLDLSVGDGLVTDMRAGHDVRICWSRDGDRLYFTASGPGATGLFSVDVEGHVRAEVGGQRRIFDFDIAGGVLAFAASDTSDPGELHVVMRGAEARLTDLNPWLRERQIAQPEEQSFTAPDGWVIQGWLLKPPGFDPEKVHPLVMQIHGGPHAEYGWAFFLEHQILAGMGYLVLYVNPRGSDGYGEVFRRAVARDWGGRDFVDLMSALDQLIERTGFVDTTRLGVGGGSYGGFMTNWIIGHTDRFAAAVSARSISNLVSEYAQHDIVLWGQMELGPPPWPDPDELWERSPIRYVNQVETPLLLTCGEMDLRCAISQSEELFGALRLLGKTVEFIRFPEESHDISRNGRPDRREERLRRIGAWYERFLGTASSDRPLAGAPADEALAEPSGVAEPAEEMEEAEAPAVSEPEPQEEPAAAEAAVEISPAEAAEPEPAAEEIGAGSEAAEEVETAVGETKVLPTQAADEATFFADVADTLPPQAAPAAESTAETAAPAAAIEPDVADTIVPEPAAAAVPDSNPPALPSADDTASIPVLQLEPEPEPEAEPEPMPVSESKAEPALEPPVPAPGSVPTWDEAPHEPPLAPLTWDSYPAREPQGAQPEEAKPAAEPVPSLEAASPEPQPSAPAVAPTAPPAAPPPASATEAPAAPPPGSPLITSTIVSWPTGGGAPAGEGRPESEAGGTEATSIMPAWQPSQGASTKETLALHSMTPEQATAEPPAKLSFETGPFAGRVVGIPEQTARIGRAPDNDIVIGDPATSGRHCRIEVREGLYWISDLGSTNGTLVNGEPIIDKQLDHGDVISIGQNTIRFAIRG